MAFLQRVVNSKGKINREYALGRGRVDLLVEWLSNQRIVIELKLNYGPKTLADGLKQTRDYMEVCGVNEGYLVIFDRTGAKGWDERMYQRDEIVDGKTVHVWGM